MLINIPRFEPLRHNIKSRDIKSRRISNAKKVCKRWYNFLYGLIWNQSCSKPKKIVQELSLYFREL